MAQPESDDSNEIIHNNQSSLSKVQEEKLSEISKSQKNDIEFQSREENSNKREFIYSKHDKKVNEINSIPSINFEINNNFFYNKMLNSKLFPKFLAKDKKSPGASLSPPNQRSSPNYINSITNQNIGNELYSNMDKIPSNKSNFNNPSDFNQYKNIAHNYDIPENQNYESKNLPENSYQSYHSHNSLEMSKAFQIQQNYASNPSQSTSKRTIKTKSPEKEEPICKR